MKKIINEFADKAGFLIEGDQIYADSFDSINDILEEFAQLIIQECINQVGYFKDFGPDGAEGEWASDVLRSHFGVE